jgi:hypothetical protein
VNTLRTRKCNVVEYTKFYGGINGVCVASFKKKKKLTTVVE